MVKRQLHGMHSGGLVKDFMTILQEEFLFLFNLSLRTGKVPDEWKQATVTPIPKVKGCPSPGDLRPISILPTPIKAERADKQLLNLMYKRVNNSMYPKETLNGITRQQEKIKFQTERPRCERYKNFPLYYGSKLWDSLASTTQKCENITTFKNQINQIYR